jgi:hypothetical protein
MKKWAAVFSFLFAWIAFGRAEDLKEYEAAERHIGWRDARYGLELLPLLRSPNLYTRNMALQRYDALPDVVPPSALPDLLRLLEDDAIVHSGRCVSALAVGFTTAEGINEEQGECRAHAFKEKPSNAKLAAKVLRSMLYTLTEEAARLMVVRVFEAPHSAPSFAPLLRGDGHVDCAILAKALDRPGPPAAIEGMLGILLQMGNSCLTDRRARLAHWVSSGAPRVATRAAMAVLRLGSDGPKDPALRSAALALLEKALRDPGRYDVIEDLVLSEGSFPELVRPLIARMGRKGVYHKDVIVKALGRTGDVPRDVVALFGRLLADDEMSYLHEDVLRAIRSLGSDSRSLKGAILRHAAVVSKDPEHAKLDLILGALNGMEVTLATGELRLLERIYRRGCAEEVVSFGYHSTGLGNWCSDAEEALERIARRSRIRLLPRL